ncbi:hypothetical protein CJ030_MR1G000543 [Morella rubra]|uniref:Uncharacterized protein n=1 Tax=Morella rubra TaxID=262757 RepID=A0A6A1WL98_9ROSI|nr:hypothetical protein CJ030_MR1G000543 [Morella rubra]
MASVRIPNCVEDPRVPLRRPTHTNLFERPNSDEKFVGSNSNWRPRAHPVVVDTISCRQMYLRSYKFSTKESVHENKCFGRVKLTAPYRMRRIKSKAKSFGRRRRGALRRARDASTAALLSFFRRLLFCTAHVDVLAHGDT